MTQDQAAGSRCRKVLNQFKNHIKIYHPITLDHTPDWI